MFGSLCTGLLNVRSVGMIKYELVCLDIVLYLGTCFVMLLYDVWVYRGRWRYIVSVLGQEEGYKVKYTPEPEGKGVYLNVYPELSPDTDSISFKKPLS